MVKIGSYTVQAKVFEPVQEPLTVESFALTEPELILNFDTPVFSFQEEPAVSFAAPMPFTETSRFSDNYLSDLMETMRQRQMLDLDQSANSGQKSESIAFSELVWSDDDLLDTDWIGPLEKAGKTDFWSEVLEDDLILLK